MHGACTVRVEPLSRCDILIGARGFDDQWQGVGRQGVLCATEDVAGQHVERSEAALAVCAGRIVGFVRAITGAERDGASLAGLHMHAGLGAHARIIAVLGSQMQHAVAFITQQVEDE